jgi:hypothetical protein
MLILAKISIPPKYFSYKNWFVAHHSKRKTGTNPKKELNQPNKQKLQE